MSRGELFFPRRARTVPVPYALARIARRGQRSTLRVTLPRTASARHERSYALLVRRVTSNPALPFRGAYFRAGAAIDESALRPSDEWPDPPLVVEFAGRAETGWGHRRSTYRYVLWRYEGAGNWTELARASASDGSWIERLRAVALVEIGNRRVPPSEVAWRAADRVVETLERELAELDDGERELTLGFLVQEITSRAVELDVDG